MAWSKQTVRKPTGPLHTRGSAGRGRGRGPIRPGTLAELSEWSRNYQWTWYSRKRYEGSIFQQVFSIHTVSLFLDLFYMPKPFLGYKTCRLIFSQKVWRVLGQYLNFSDLKDCRLVSLSFNRMVLEATKFKTRGIVNAKPEVLALHVLGTTRENWKCMKIPISPVCSNSSCNSAFVHNTDWLCSLLKEVQEVCMVLGPSCPMEDSSGQRLRPFPARVLEKSPVLRALEIDQELLYNDIFNDCCHELTKLLQFKITASQSSSCCKELKALESVAMFAGQLQVFESSVKFDYIAEDSFQRNMNHIKQILEGSRANLVCLKLNSPFLWEPPAEQIYSFMRHKVFPQLRSIRLCITWANESEVVHFLKNQFPLQEIEIDLCSQYYGLFPKDLLGTVGTRSERLKILRISASNYTNVDLTDWKFLSLTLLEELSLWPLDNNSHYNGKLNKFGGAFMPEIFKLLPHTIRKVRLKAENDFRHCHNPIIIREWVSIDQALLTHLSISGLSGALTDTNLQLIFGKYLLLKEFHLSHGPKVTDEPFIGVQGRPHLPYIGILRGKNKVFCHISHYQCLYMSITLTF